MKKAIKKDIVFIMVCSIISAILYIVFEGPIMEYGKNTEIPLMARFLPVLIIQFGMSCLGVTIVLAKNHEHLFSYGLIGKNAIKSVIGCLLCAIPTVAFLYFNKELHGFLPFQGMFLTKDILQAPFPQNIILYALVVLVWGLGEGLFYVVLSQKINLLKEPKGVFNIGAITSAIIAILIHGMIGFDLATILEALSTFVLMYGSIIVKEKTNNSVGNILLFFVVWNAL